MYKAVSNGSRELQGFDLPMLKEFRNSSGHWWEIYDSEFLSLANLVCICPDKVIADQIVEGLNLRAVRDSKFVEIGAIYTCKKGDKNIGLPPNSKGVVKDRCNSGWRVFYREIANIYPNGIYHPAWWFEDKEIMELIV